MIHVIANKSKCSFSLVSFVRLDHFFLLVESLFAHHSEEYLDAARQRNRATGD